MVILTATSVSDATESAKAIISVPALVVNLSATSATLQLGASAPFSATVVNDGANGGVTWMVTCPQSACGSVSSGSTQSGGTAIYTVFGGCRRDRNYRLRSVAGETEKGSSFGKGLSSKAFRW